MRFSREKTDLGHLHSFTTRSERTWQTLVEQVGPIWEIREESRKIASQLGEKKNGENIDVWQKLKVRLGEQQE